jgi:hypothetical protein
MRNKFFELIEKGVAPASYKDVVSDHPELLDDVVREYNNIFSLVSDTHMDIVSDPKIQEFYPEHTWKYIITGSLIGYSMQRWEKFCVDPFTFAGGFDSRPAGYYSPADFFQKAGLAGEKRIVNGDTVYLLYSIDETKEQSSAPEQVGDPRVTDTTGIEAYVRDAASYHTTESQMPKPLSELSVNVNKKDVQECFKHKTTLAEIAQALNESETVLGDWIVFENQLIGYIANRRAAIIDCINK